MFRYARPQKGRYRQFYQFGIEYIGDKSAYADAEIIAIGWKILQEAKVPDVSLEINSVGCKECRKDYHKKLQDFLFARKDKFCPDCKRRMKTNPCVFLIVKIPPAKKFCKMLRRCWIIFVMIVSAFYRSSKKFEEAGCRFYD